MGLNFGLVGIGRWGRNYIASLEKIKGCSLRWVCSRRKESLQNPLIPYVKKTTNIEDILSDKNTQAVIIATPASTHYQLAKRALFHDKHVLLEKPGSLNSANISELFRISAKRGKVLLIGFEFLFHPAIEYLKKVLRRETIQFVEYVHTGNSPRREDINVLWDYFPHFFSILGYLDIKNIQPVSVLGKAYKGRQEDIVSAHFKSGKAAISAFSAWEYPKKRTQLTISTNRGVWCFDDQAEDKLVFHFHKGNKLENK